MNNFVKFLKDINTAQSLFSKSNRFNEPICKFNELSSNSARSIIVLQCNVAKEIKYNPDDKILQEEFIKINNYIHRT